MMSRALRVFFDVKLQDLDPEFHTAEGCPGLSGPALTPR